MHVTIGRGGQVSVVEWEIRVGGSVPASVLEELHGMQFSPAGEEFALRGCLADQSALLGVIARLHHGGIKVRWIRSLGPNDGRLHTERIETVLQGPVPDQAALISIIFRLQAWGIDLRGLRCPDPGDVPVTGGTRQVGEVASGAPHYEIRVSGGLGPIVAMCLRRLNITVPEEATAAAEEGVEQPAPPVGGQNQVQRHSLGDVARNVRAGPQVGKGLG